MLRPIDAMNIVRPSALLALALVLAAPASGGEGITATVGVTPACPYGLAG